MSRYEDRIAELGVQFFAISADDFSEADYIPGRPEIRFPILYDASRETIQKYGVLNGNIAHPATFVIDSDGVIRWKRVDQNYTDRPSADTVLAQISALAP